MLTLESRGELLAELARLRKAFTDLIKVEPLGASTTQTLFLKRVCIRTSIPVTLSILYQVGGFSIGCMSGSDDEPHLPVSMSRAITQLHVEDVIT